MAGGARTPRAPQIAVAAVVGRWEWSREPLRGHVPGISARLSVRFQATCVKNGREYDHVSRN